MKLVHWPLMGCYIWYSKEGTGQGLSPSRPFLAAVPNVGLTAHYGYVSQRVVFKTAFMVWKCVHGVAPAYLSDLAVRTRYCQCHLRSSASAICSDWHSTGSTRPLCNWTTKFRSQRTSHMEPSATSTTVTGPVGECLQAGTENAPVLDWAAPLRSLPDSGAGYKYPDLLTYLPITVLLYNGLLLCGFIMVIKGLNNKSLLGGVRHEV